MSSLVIIHNNEYLSSFNMVLICTHIDHGIAFYQPYRLVIPCRVFFGSVQILYPPSKTSKALIFKQGYQGLVTKAVTMILCSGVGNCVKGLPWELRLPQNCMGGNHIKSTIFRHRKIIDRYHQYRKSISDCLRRCPCQVVTI